MTFKEHIEVTIGIPQRVMKSMGDLVRGSVAEKVGKGDLEKALEVADDFQKYRGKDAGSFVIAKKDGADPKIAHDVYDQIRREFLAYHEREGFILEIESDTPLELAVIMRKGETSLRGSVLMEEDASAIYVAFRDLNYKEGESEDISGIRRA